ncbi:hypothetical protein K6119_07815 [Paracrocinitomix mangrovi]|uniref:hypothetical protein n=1 Tax=Paracrocinitomix mangrovi TaxID=2862509 RepID=UPI001EDAF8CD|nr:hypothetical protein [Paracrocinitomix mangrovi]UKN03420.1 hypothetical protein K6119_07815 [Paracrocinitomix mangrovi]
MRAYLSIFILMSFSWFKAYGQLYFPNEQYYNSELDRFFLKDSVNQNFYNSHQSLKPILDKRTNPDSIFYKDSKHYYWITQKLFKENFLIFEGKDFWCAVDPILDLEGGTDFSADSLDILYWNTRGIRVQAKFLDKVAFTTSVYENQAVLPNYYSNYIDQYGEFRPSGSNYKQENAVVPGYARTKTFKTNGYDFAFAEGQVSIVPNEYFNVQFGNGNQFIGNGHRSLLLSDFSSNYPFAKFEGNFLKGRIQYNAIYAVHQNLYRLPFFNSVESTYERKIGTYHYLDFAITPKINVGLFEGALWQRTDSLGSHQPNWLFVNPVPFVNAAVMSKNDSTYNHVLGINYSWAFLKNRLYGQVVLDNGFGGFQLGIKSYDLFIENFDVRAEYNMSKRGTYFSSNKRYNYSHNNLSLAHPLASGFTEYILQLKYEFKEFFITNETVYSRRDIVDTNYRDINIVNDNINSINLMLGDSRRTLINTLEIGYRFNKRYNLQAVAGWMFRNGSGQGPDTHTNYVYCAVRTRLRNKTRDF